jgi:hypothetical protein
MDGKVLENQFGKRRLMLKDCSLRLPIAVLTVISQRANRAAGSGATVLAHAVATPQAAAAGDRRRMVTL